MTTFQIVSMKLDNWIPEALLIRMRGVIGKNGLRHENSKRSGPDEIILKSLKHKFACKKAGYTFMKNEGHPFQHR